MKIGDIVKLKSSEHKMTVTYIAERYITCAWFDKDIKINFTSINEDALEIVPQTSVLPICGTIQSPIFPYVNICGTIQSMPPPLNIYPTKSGDYPKYVGPCIFKS